MSIIRKTSWLTAGKLTGDILAFVFYMSIARFYGADQIGNYAFAFAFVAFFGFGIELGFRSFVTREVAKDRSIVPEYIGNIFSFQLLLSLFFSLLLFLLIILQGYSTDLIIMLTLAYLSVALQSVSFSFIACLEAVEEMKKSALILLTERVIIILLGFLFIYLRFELRYVLISHVTGSTVLFIITFYSVNKLWGTIQLKLKWLLFRKIFIAVIPFLGASALNVLYSRVDIVMLHYFVGEFATGSYAVAYRLIEPSLVIAQMAGLAIYPVLSRLTNDQIEERSKVFFLTLKWLSFLGVAGLAVLIAAGDHLVVLILGNEYNVSGSLIRYMSVLFLVGCIKVPYWRLLYASGREYFQLRSQVVSIGTNIVLNFVFIPLYGAFGAVYSSIISEIILFILFYYSCKNLVAGGYLSSIARLGIAGGITVAVGILCRAYLPLIVNVIITLVVFIVFLVVFNLIKEKDKRLFRQYLNIFSVKNN